jgi:ectoine hydroxylase-related dioxygenase (phytanoyl-CoA dioxygenase family)
VKDLSLSEHGTCLSRGVVTSNIIIRLAKLFGSSGKAGVRLTGLGPLASEFSANGIIGSIAAGHLGSNVRPVRAIAFDKSDASNWALGWHQDRTICVQGRHEVQGYGPWTVKQGLHHVAPPFDLLSGMVTIRVHIDPVDETNAPLLVALGSHRLGLISEDDISSVTGRCATLSCQALAGDVWVYSTPILHASERARPGQRRRVLQIDYSADSLPPPLEWLDVS